jgi:carboxyl-terminal processing protease
MIIKKISFVIVSLSFLHLSLFAQFSEQSIKFVEVFDKISRFYVDTVNEEKLVEKVIVGMLNDLDPHSSYLSKDEVKAMQEPLDGGFDGIGVSFNIMQDTIYIISPIAGGPSEKLGIKAGDRIIKIDGENVAGVGIVNADVQTKLKGPKGTRVTVEISRRNVDDLLEFAITRDKIPIYSIDAAYMVNKNTGYIKLSRFSLSSMDEFNTAMKKLRDQKMENLILDLSGNGGGYLRVAVDLADQFISGKKMIVYTEGTQNPRRDYFSSDKGEFKEGKLVVMIDESSASASEIVAGAVQDWDRAVIVGRRSFGKGLVQQPFLLNDGSLIRLTVAKYYTPTGRLIQKSYSNGFDDYSRELITRYNSGELAGDDYKIFPDSLKNRTLIKKRIVYGGGGIMPDYFVPIDTTAYSEYYRSLLRLGILNRFVLQYVDDNRTSLNKNYPNFEKFKNNFTVSDIIINDLKNFADNEEVIFSEADYQLSKNMIHLLIKAYIARDLWESNEFYQIFNQSDPIFKRASEIISNVNLYEEKLQAFSDE